VRRLLLPIVVAPLLAVAVACAPSRPADAVAQVGDEVVLYPELAGYVEAETDSPPAALESTVLSRLLDQYLTERMLVRLAAERELVAPGAGHREALAALLAASPPPAPSRDELRARYRDQAAEYRLPARVRLRQVLTETREAAEAARAQIAGGADFGRVARQRSIDPSAPYGGFQGVLAEDDLPEDFADLIFGLEPGEVSEIVEADYGFHIFQVIERLPERTVPFDEAAPAIAERLREEGEREALARLVETARSRYTVRIYGPNLPFDYRGSLPLASD
jgi:peptidyl-prolyl cis-trans isomerase C